MSARKKKEEEMKRRKFGRGEWRERMKGVRKTRKWENETRVRRKEKEECRQGGRKGGEKGRKDKCVIEMRERRYVVRKGGREERGEEDGGREEMKRKKEMG